MGDGVHHPAPPTGPPGSISATTTGTDTSGWGPIAFILPGSEQPADAAARQMGTVDYPTAPWNNAALQAMLRQGAGQQTASPYNPAIADQTRPAQIALYQQMLQQMQGNSLASLQGNAAMGQSAQQQFAAQAGAGSPLGARGASNQAQDINAGLANQTGQGRLAEQMGTLGGVAGGLGQMRGLDLTAAGQQARLGLQQRAVDDQATRFYVQQGMTLDNAIRQANIDRLVIQKKLTSSYQAQQVENYGNLVSVGATVLAGPGFGHGG